MPEFQWPGGGFGGMRRVPGPLQERMLGEKPLRAAVMWGKKSENKVCKA